MARTIIGRRSIVSVTTIANTPPGSPVNGQIHLVGPAPAGAFSTFAPTSLAIYDGVASVWRNTELENLDGWAILDYATGKQYFHNGTTLREVSFAGGGGGGYVFTNTDRLYGRDSAGGGAGEEIAVGGGLEFTGSLSIQIAAGGVAGSMLRSSAALSVMGNPTNAAAAPVDVAATANGNGVLRESGSTLGWGLLVNANLATAAGIQKSKLEISAALSVVGRSANATGAPADIATGPGTGAVLRESANTLGWGLLVSANISNGAGITRTQLAQGAARSVVGVAGNAVANVADIAAAASSSHVLREAAGTIGWGLIASANLDPAAGITRGQLANGAALSVAGVAGNAAAALADIAATAGGNGVLRELGSTLAWGLLASANLAPAAGITRAQLANSPGLSIMGNAGMAAAAPQDLTTTGGSGAVIRESGGAVGWGLLANANVSATAGIAASKLANSAARSVLGNPTTGFAAPTDIVATNGSFGVLQEATGNLVFGPVSNASIATGAGIAKSKLENSVACSVVGRSANSTGPLADIASSADGQILARKASVVGWFTPAAQTLYQKVYDGPALWGQSGVAYPTLAQTNPTGFTLTNAERHFIGFIMTQGQINWLRFGFSVPADLTSTNVNPRICFVLNGAPAAGAKIDLTIRGAYFSDNDLSSGGTAFFVNNSIVLTGYAAADYVILDLAALGLGLIPGQYIQGVIERHSLSNPADTYPDIIGIAWISFRGSRVLASTFPDLPGRGAEEEPAEELEPDDAVSPVRV